MWRTLPPPLLQVHALVNQREMVGLKAGSPLARFYEVRCSFFRHCYEASPLFMLSSSQPGLPLPRIPSTEQLTVLWPCEKTASWGACEICEAMDRNSELQVGSTAER